MNEAWRFRGVDPAAALQRVVHLRTVTGQTGSNLVPGPVAATLCIHNESVIRA